MVKPAIQFLEDLWTAKGNKQLYSIPALTFKDYDELPRNHSKQKDEVQ